MAATVMLIVILFAPSTAAAQLTAGVAHVDITPDFPVRLSGFAGRREESQGITQRIWAKALALGGDQEKPAVLITVDNLGLPGTLVQSVAEQLERECGIEAARVSITFTHTHTAPMVTGANSTLFGAPIPETHQQHIDRYTAELREKLVRVAQAALADLKPATMGYTVGRVRFAANRRQKGGPVDHDLRVLAVKHPDGRVRAVYTSYACHCVTLSNNQISGDWAGYAQELIERAIPGAMAMVSIGCGADADPDSGVTGDRVDIATQQGTEIADEVQHLLEGALVPIRTLPTIRQTTVKLPLDALPTEGQWHERALRDDAIGYHARVQLERLARGEPLISEIDYTVQTWAFGDDLAIVFLPGEVVVDYALRLKRELDGKRLWINAYSNASPCYIPSERVLSEGGYEAGDAMIYYDIPARFAPGLENKIVAAVHEQMGEAYRSTWNSESTEGTSPLSPAHERASFSASPGLVVELVASEPLVVDPVAIDFGPDGRLWVAEMHDYPLGLDGNYQPGGRIKILTDTDSDGRYDQSSVFLDGLPFPTGVTVWRNGALICAAPDILYAEDTDGDSRADVRRKLYEGFATDNYQARINSLSYGLDNWVYAACGLFGGRITSFSGATAEVQRDLRFKPDTGEVEGVTGVTQQGRVRDDWGNWFGCSNGVLLQHYPLIDHYLARNPHLAPPNPTVPCGEYGRLYPTSRPLERFNDPDNLNRVTSGCGLGLYRDDLLGDEYRGNAFTCEPVHNLVVRLELAPEGTTFRGGRPSENEQAEFLTSSDNWFRPVQARTGPDGALWIVDMYRFLIEHPRWIQPDRLARIDVRAGDSMGRIWRIYHRDRPPRSPTRLEGLNTPALVAAIDSPNGTQRDLAQQMLVWRHDALAVPHLQKLARRGSLPEARVQALSTLDALHGVTAKLALDALADPHPGVRRHAVRLCERFREVMASRTDMANALSRLADDPDPQVRCQLAYSLGEWRQEWAAQALARLALSDYQNPYLLAAVGSSLNERNLPIVVNDVLAARASLDKQIPHTQTVARWLVPQAVAWRTGDAVARLVNDCLGTETKEYTNEQVMFCRVLTDAVAQERTSLAAILGSDDESVLAIALVERMLAVGRKVASNPGAADDERIRFVGLLGRQGAQDIPILTELLVPQTPVELQLAVVAALVRIDAPMAAEALFAEWPGYGPTVRAAVLEGVLSRGRGAGLVLDQLESGRMPAAQFDAFTRQQLLTHPDDGVRLRAATLFNSEAGSDRRQVVARHADVAAMAGDPLRGRKVFAARCATCHKLADEGHVVGPDLAALTDKSPTSLLVAILDPNRAVEARYVSYSAITTEGTAHTGILAAETSNTITLLSPDGKEQILFRSQVDELESGGKSLMPEGMERDLSKQDLADLIAMLRGGAPARRQFAGNEPREVTPDADGALVLPAAAAEIYGTSIVFETPFQNIGYWHNQEDLAAWTIALEEPGKYKVLIDYACHDDSAGNQFLLEGGEGALTGTVPGTGGWDRYQSLEIGTLSLPSGQSRLIMRPAAPVKGALFDLRTIRLEPHK